MKYSIFTKFVAIVLCAVSLVVCAAGAAGIIISEDNGLYTNDVDNWLDTELTHIGYYIARDYCSLYVTERLEGFPEDVLEALRDDCFVSALRWSRYQYTFCTGFNMNHSFFFSCEDTCTFKHDINVHFFPR